MQGGEIHMDLIEHAGLWWAFWKIDRRQKPYNIKNKALPHCKKCGKFLQANRKYETWCSWCESFA